MRDRGKDGPVGETPTDQAIEEAVRTILRSCGEDVGRDGLRNTPKRVRRMYAELLRGYHVDPAALINGALFDEPHEEMVLVRDIEYSSLCEHHILPFLGHAQVAYIPNGRIIGLSKIPRVIDMYAHRLQVQERLTDQIADFLMDVLKPHGVAVVMDGVHLCSLMRGVRKHDSAMTTSAMRGRFREDANTRAEFLAHIGRPIPRPF